MIVFGAAGPEVKINSKKHRHHRHWTSGSCTRRQSPMPNSPMWAEVVVSGEILMAIYGKKQEKPAETATSTKPKESQVLTVTAPQNFAKCQVDNKGPEGPCQKPFWRLKSSTPCSNQNQ